MQEYNKASKPRLWIRADGNSAMGLGHIFRCLALANMLQEMVQLCFFVRTPSGYLRQVISEQADLVALPSITDDLAEAKTIAKQYLTGEEVVVLDGYHFNTAYQTIIRAKSAALVCIDDIHACAFVADIVINHAGSAQAEQYQRAAHTQLYLGLSYSLLQAPFLEAAGAPIKPPKEGCILLCLGGADPKNDTLRVLRRLEKQKVSALIRVVLGGSYQYHQELDAFIQYSKLNIQKLSRLTSLEMRTAMEQSAAIICSPSTVAYEAMSIGRPVYLIAIADNQAEIYTYFIAQGLAVDFIKAYPIINKKKKQELTKRQALYFDGGSGKRLQAIFSALLPEKRT